METLGTICMMLWNIVGCVFAVGFMGILTVCAVWVIGAIVSHIILCIQRGRSGMEWFDRNS